VIKRSKNHLNLFLQNQVYFSAFNWVLKGFSKNLFIFIQISILKSDKTLSLSPARPGPPVGLGPPISASLPG
jgi:hypothetical protein